jgi:hypothetical protein
VGGTGVGGAGGVLDGGSAGAPDSGIDPCPALRTDVEAKLIAAQKCDPTQVQCQDVMAGICCKAPVASQASPEAQAYQAALDKFNAAQCKVICTIFCRTGTPYCAATPNNGANCAFGP